MREFYQCDFDIAGEYDAMIPDAEILKIMVEVFESVGLGEDVTIKLNHRKILDGMFAVCGVPADKTRAISSAVDKLDKSPWEEVKKEMLEKGLESDVADRIGEYTQHGGELGEIIAYINSNEALMANEQVKQGLSDMERLLRYLTAFGVGGGKVKFDLSLARGLDYYTGLIYEAVIELPQEKSSETRIGSIAAGGRYDNLVGMYGRRKIPCIGVSFGVDRIFTILKQRHEDRKVRARSVDVFVMAFGGKNGLLEDRMRIAAKLWEAGVKAEFSAKEKPKLPQQFKAAEVAGVPLAVILGEDELKAGKVRVKTLGLPDGHPEKEGRLVDTGDMVAEVRRLLACEEQPQPPAVPTLTDQVGEVTLEEKP
jgi:histidyl-tRNA synthetase